MAAKASHWSSVSGRSLNSRTASRVNAVNDSRSYSSSEVPTMRPGGSSPAWNRCSRPGSSLRLARSPVAPNITITCGSSMRRSVGAPRGQRKGVGAAYTPARGRTATVAGRTAAPWPGATTPGQGSRCYFRDQLKWVRTLRLAVEPDGLFTTPAATAPLAEELLPCQVAPYPL